jgi:hypothetical protein
MGQSDQFGFMYIGFMNLAYNRLGNSGVKYLSKANLPNI